MHMKDILAYRRDLELMPVRSVLWRGVDVVVPSEAVKIDKR